MIDNHLSIFHNECDYYLKIYYDVLNLYSSSDDNPLFTRDLRDMLINYTLLCIYSAWEKFLQNIFIAYMLGEKSKTGKSVNLFVHPIDEEHAYRLIKNTNLYPDWSDIEKVLINANNFFEDSGPFKVLTTMRTELNALKKVRNCIAHSSIKALEDFYNLVRGTIGYLPTDISTASYVIDYSPKNVKPKRTYFEYYLKYLKDASALLAD